jgi:hypothetical protein
VTLSGIGGPEPLFNCKFTNNIVRGGPIFCTDVNQLTIQDNTIEVADFGAAQRIPIEVQRGGEAVLITGNIVVNDGTVTGAAISLGEVRRGVARTTIARNLCFTRSGNGIQCLSSDGVAIHGNMIVATEPCDHGIFIRSQSSDVNDVSIRNNEITGRERGAWSSGITIAATAPHQVRDFSVIGNSVHHATRGLAFEGTGFDATPVCALNCVADDVEAPLTGIEKLPGASLIVGGAASRGGTDANSGAGRYLAGLGEPDNRISGGVGDIFQRLDGGLGTTLYVKESGHGTSSGWAAK